jgi:hypothetical protein
MEGAMTAALNATEAALLGLLHERPMTGWDLVVTRGSESATSGR